MDVANDAEVRLALLNGDAAGPLLAPRPPPPLRSRAKPRAPAGRCQDLMRLLRSLAAAGGPPALHLVTWREFEPKMQETRSAVDFTLRLRIHQRAHLAQERPSYHFFGRFASYSKNSSHLEISRGGRSALSPHGPQGTRLGRRFATGPRRRPAMLFAQPLGAAAGHRSAHLQPVAAE